MSHMTPQEIVHELDRHIIGQADAKRAVAIALRNRWRRQQVAEPLRQEITPKNILMIGPTGVGDVLEPEHGVVAIGSGGSFAQAAARALLDNTDLKPAEIVKKSLEIAGDLCIYTNQQHTIEVLGD